MVPSMIMHALLKIPDSVLVSVVFGLHVHLVLAIHILKRVSNEKRLPHSKAAATKWWM